MDKDEEKNFIIISSDGSIHAMLPTRVSKRDWAMTLSNALVMAGQEFARVEQSCPCCIVDSLKEVLQGAMEHFEENNLLEDGCAIARQYTIDPEDYHGLLRAIFATVGLAIMCEGTMPHFMNGKDVLINIDHLRFSYYPQNHDNLDKEHAVVH